MMNKQIYKEIKKQIRFLEKIKEGQKVYVTEKREITKCYGHGDFEGTGKYRKFGYYKQANTPEIDEEIRRLYELIKPEEERKALIRKKKRYEKELAELEDRKAYLEKWLADFEETN